MGPSSDCRNVQCRGVRGRPFTRLLALAVCLTAVPAIAGLSLNGTGITFDGETVEQQTAFPGPWARVLGVAPAGAEFTDPLAALAAIPEAPDPDAPSADRPYLVRVGPGTYDLGPAALPMRSHVAIVGAGQAATLIRGTGNDDGAVVLGADDALLQHLSVLRTEGGEGAAIRNNAVSPQILDVTAEAAAGNSENIAIDNAESSAVLTRVTARAFAAGSEEAIGIRNTLGAPTLNRVTVRVNGATPTGILNDESAPLITGLVASSSTVDFDINTVMENDNGSAPTMTDVVLEAWGGSSVRAILNTGASSATMTNVRAEARSPTPNGAAIAIDSGIGGHQVMTNVEVFAEAATCCDAEGMRNSYTSVEMTNVTVTVRGGSETWGIWNFNTDAVAMTNVRVSAEGGAVKNRGVYNTAASPVMNNVTIRVADGTAENYGIYNEDGSAPRMQGIVATAAGDESYGMFSTGSAPVVRGSRFAGGTGGLNGISATTRISDTQIVNAPYGDVSGSQCRNVYDENHNNLRC